MAKQASEEKKWHHMHKSGGGGNAVYVFGMFGALFYYLQHATSFVDGLFGILKAILWPAFLIYKVLEVLKM